MIGQLLDVVDAWPWGHGFFCFLWAYVMDLQRAAKTSDKIRPDGLAHIDICSAGT